MNLLDVLRDEHATADRLFNDIFSTEDRARREQLFETLKEALLAHAHAEEKIFYPPLHDQAPSHDLIEDGIKEHHHVEELLRRMENIPLESADWLETLRTVREEIQHHVREEESEIFPKAQKALGDGTLDEMTERFMQAESQEKAAH